MEKPHLFPPIHCLQSVGGLVSIAGWFYLRGGFTCAVVLPAVGLPAVVLPAPDAVRPTKVLYTLRPLRDEVAAPRCYFVRSMVGAARYPPVTSNPAPQLKVPTVAGPSG